MRHALRVIGFLALIFASFPAFAVTGTFSPAVSGLFTDYSTAALGTGVLQVIPANNARKYLVIQNPGAVIVGCSYGNSPSIGAVGTVVLGQYGSWNFDGNFIYSGPVYCTAASGSANVLVVLEGN